ncbi:PQQ-dependent sugar dehydrogenase [Arenibacterium halophilum]|uniref:PQQ-dependent sugar dehydrogenase n=1 Tax=Arenibacterium halophilum TaxID=2583821 RepID=A0ABY2XAL2_9RHOB|nr:PQQ-dependent sugar dehydrogenase [Arenibacterium halophilum]TMV13412.1 PQQ-dependent sugar dehydrogenase [Arenibacterium halophilum]
MIFAGNIARGLVIAGLFSGPVAALDTSVGELTATEMVSGLSEPWAIGLLPKGGFLVTERTGRLLLVQDGQAQAVDGAPEVWANGQGGLLDVTIARDFDQSREIFLTYAHPQQGGGSTALAVARLSDDGSRLENLRRIFAASPVSSAGRHFGSRVVEAEDGTLFLTLGERGDRPSSQDLGSHNGSVIRINRDGSVPRDNPFTETNGALPEIWSYGHRNIQGAGLDGAGKLVIAEHGARGGDEVNRPKKGANFGWPVISYGVHYSGAKIGEGTAKDGMEQPEFYWDPSIAPSGLIVHSGKMFPEWEGDTFVGSLKFDYIARLSGSPLTEVEQIEGTQTARVRDLAEGPDGAIWFISVGQGAVYRLTRG